MKVILITGSMGCGKTTVLGEASDILAARDIEHAAIDLDWLGNVHLHKEVTNPGLVYRNLALVWRNYAALGLTRLLLANAVETQMELQSCRDALPHAEIVVCRLTADLQTMQERVRVREPGGRQETYVARVAELEVLLDRAGIESISIRNQDRSVTEVARDLLVRTGWLAE